MKGPPRFVLLTSGHPHAIRILNGLADRGIEVVAVVHETPDNPHWAAVSSGNAMARTIALAKGSRHSADKVVRTVRVLRTFRSLARRVVVTGSLNSRRMRTDLEALAPDYILLGGIGILKRELIETARAGVVNAHPGLLPWIRGTGVVGAALQRGIPVGGSCHWVNAGIDRGAIISRRLLPISGTETSLQEVEQAANLLISDMMVCLVSNHLWRGERLEATVQTEIYPMCRWVSHHERAELDEDIRNGLAKSLFERWKSRCLDQELYYLPRDLDFVTDLPSRRLL
jgi:methionyl-tRNA formyltransferase